MAWLPNAGAGMDARLPIKDPMGVRRADKMTTDLLISDVLRGREDTVGKRAFFWFCWEFKKQR